MRRASPAFPRHTNWLEHAARAAAGAALPFDALFPAPPKYRDGSGGDGGRGDFEGDDDEGEGDDDDGEGDDHDLAAGGGGFGDPPRTLDEKIKYMAESLLGWKGTAPGAQPTAAERARALDHARKFFEFAVADEAAEVVEAFDAPEHCDCSAECKAAAKAARTAARAEKKAARAGAGGRA